MAEHKTFYETLMERQAESRRYSGRLILKKKDIPWHVSPQGRNAAIVDRANTTMSVWMGTTMACAQCHDHPLADWKQRDFYQMAAFFGATDEKDEKMLGMVRKAAGKAAGKQFVPQPKSVAKKTAAYRK